MTETEWNHLTLNTLTPASPAVPGVPAVLAVDVTAPSQLDPLGTPAILASDEIVEVPATAATYRPMTDWTVPVPPTGTSHTVRDAYKRAFDKHQVFSEASIILRQIYLSRLVPI